MGIASVESLVNGLKRRADSELEKRKRAGTYVASHMAHIEYQGEPLRWIVEKLGVPEHTLRWSLNSGYIGHEWDGDVDPLVVALEALAGWHDVGIESATGTGKTFLAACVVLWFLACFEDSLVVTSAPKADQLLTQLWKEIGQLWPRFKVHFPDAELLTGKVRMRPGQDTGKETWVALAFVAGVGADEEAAQKAAGFHRAHMLIITEDTPGIQAPIMEAFQNTRTDDHNLHFALGNPDHRNDQLHRFCFDKDERRYEGVVHLRISALDHPNIVCGRDPLTNKAIIPGAIGPRRIKERTARYGKGGRLYQSRIRGICPAEAQDALIKWEWCRAAAARYHDPAYRLGGRAMGVDVAASEAGDKGAIARWEGSCCTEVEDFACPDPNALGRRVVLEARDADNPVDRRFVGIDDVGVGAGTVNECRRLGFKVRYISGGRKAIPGLDTDTLWSTMEDEGGQLRATGPVVVEAERFNNTRSQVWYRLREDLRLGRIALPEDEELWSDLTTPTYGTRNGQIFVEPKEAIIARLRRSPNKGDACAYGNFVRPRTWEAPGSVRRARAEEQEGMGMGKNRDWGLERRLAQHEKRTEDERRRIRRAFKKFTTKGRTG